MPEESESKKSATAGRGLIFAITLAVCTAVSAWGLSSPETLGDSAAAFIEFVLYSGGWFFMAITTGFLLLSVFLAFSRYGKLRLGRHGDEPEFSTASWLAMLFSAGMGAGLLFWGAAEPIIHFESPPMGAGGTSAAARHALALACFHWGLHAWGIYGISALVLAYFGSRKQMPTMPGQPIRAIFYGRWVKPVAAGVDLVAILAVCLGVAGSLAIGILQIRAGLHVLTSTPASATWMSVAILLVLALTYNISAATRIDKGIRILSNINLVIAIGLMIALLLLGPTAFLLRTTITSLGDYLSSLVSLSFSLYPYQDPAWARYWTLNYFIYWIAWAPFVGIFIARISRGRTIREFVLGVIVAPTLLSIIWFAVFGGSALHEEMFGSGGIAEMVNEDVNMALFGLFARFPLASLLSVATIVLVFIFLVTSADSATFVLGMLTTGGALNPSRRNKLTWGVYLVLLTAAMLFTDNVHTIRAVVVGGAIPFALIMLLQVVAMLKSLRQEDPDDDRRNSERAGDP